MGITSIPPVQIKLINQLCRMFTRLQRKWNVNGTQFFCVFSTFAVTGTVTAWVSRSVTSWIEVSAFSFSWWALKIGVLLIGYQVFLLFFGFLFGQFSFFWKYEKKLLGKLGILPTPDFKHITIFASGGGSNAKKIIEHFNRPGYKGVPAKVNLIICNRTGAGVIRIAEDEKIKHIIIDKASFFTGDSCLENLKNTDLVVLAGFLWKIPDALINAFPKKIVNIHPALLPAYGGKGMYGTHVHHAVVDKGEKETGITIHYVDEQYDNGDIIFQKTCPVEPGDDAQTVATKVQALEHRFYPQVIESLLKAKS